MTASKVTLSKGAQSLCSGSHPEKKQEENDWLPTIVATGIHWGGLKGGAHPKILG